MALYNSCELLLMIATRFKEWRSLLFMSLVVSSLGIIPYYVGFLTEYFQWTAFWAAMTISTFGWVMLVTGQSVVLYSRLGLILNNPSILKGVKWLIITDAILFHVPTTVVQYGKTYGDERVAFGRAMYYLEKIQMTGFCVQEFIISGLYLWAASQLLTIIKKQGTRRVMVELVVVNIAIVLGDIALLVLEYSGERVMERTWKGLVYSVKLKLEFAILSKLVDLVQSSQRTLSNALADVNTFVDVSRANSGADGMAAVHQQVRTSKDESMPDWISKLEDRDVQTSHLEDVQYPRQLDDDPFITRKEV
ncbi:hypothetical protein PMZ80_005108 [Knufia obscura]|uniref:DUF7703 domain-containing protein n=1 Tax=Knufia obscura TaxID=1635080 RepID=A0ABR0RQN0_9EURO|nr:hypothetical protein PMZ80_005108 [Knufia obscura]